jgi:hypothetical protein
VQRGFAAQSDDGIVITESGLRKVGKIRESREERRRKAANASLKAQASGKWDPAPAGSSALASEGDALKRGEWAEAVNDVNAAQETLNGERQLLEMAKEWNAGQGLLDALRAQIEVAKKELDRAKAELERLRMQRQAT